MEDRIKDILKSLHDRTAWGVCQDVIELAEMKAHARTIIELADTAILTVEIFIKKYGRDPETPKEEEE